MIIKTKNLTKEYEAGSQIVKALNGIDLSVEKGEFISIMGPSGSGKTTLMNIIGCLDSPTNGTYYLNERSVSELDDDELAKIRNEEIGFVFQSFHLFCNTKRTFTSEPFLPEHITGKTVNNALNAMS